MSTTCFILCNTFYAVPLDEWNLMSDHKGPAQGGLCISFTSLTLLLDQLMLQSLEHACLTCGCHVTGLFHLTMNLIWALLHVHRGSIHQIGSLSYFFAILNCTQLGCEHPDYHTLLSTLLQTLHRIILNAWQVECGCPSFAAFTLSNPSADNLL